MDGFKVEITSTEVDSFQWKNDKGNSGTIRNQECYIHAPHFAYPQIAKLTLEKEQLPYAVGMYSLDPQSFQIDKNKRLEVRMKLSPLVDTAAPFGKKAASL